MHVTGAAEVVPSILILRIKFDRFFQPPDRIRIVVQQDIVQADNFEIVTCRPDQRSRLGINCQRFCGPVLTMEYEAKEVHRVDGIAMGSEMFAQNGFGSAEIVQVNETLGLKKKGVCRARIGGFHLVKLCGRSGVISGAEFGRRLLKRVASLRGSANRSEYADDNQTEDWNQPISRIGRAHVHCLAGEFALTGSSMRRI
jgi:hypothetical protein